MIWPKCMAEFARMQRLGCGSGRGHYAAWNGDAAMLIEDAAIGEGEAP